MWVTASEAHRSTTLRLAGWDFPARSGKDAATWRAVALYDPPMASTRRRRRLKLGRPHKRNLRALRGYEHGIILRDIAALNGWVGVNDLDREYPGRYDRRHLSAALKAMATGHYARKGMTVPRTLVRQRAAGLWNRGWVYKLDAAEEGRRAAA